MTEKEGLRTIQLGFASAALDDEVVLEGVRGHEELSRLYEYELLLRTQEGPLSSSQIDDLLDEPCVIALGDRAGDLVHGLLAEIETIDAPRQGGARYRARLVPHMALLSQGSNSAVYQETSVPDMVRSILTEHGFQDGTHFDVRVAQQAKSPVREYLVQYQESNWDFIQRWLEHEGFFYWFNHHKDGAELVIADAND
ncbi:MAG: hypothetical protein JRI23_15550, partial [Deltaproteobacteria bacterium]|nr:hypothetical protein [Deltaproteobacteria bacterium]MBW2533168.1 hypothetical protein [Deltaproteobacteria bacterium]